MDYEVLKNWAQPLVLFCPDFHGDKN